MTGWPLLLVWGGCAALSVAFWVAVAWWLL